MRASQSESRLWFWRLRHNLKVRGVDVWTVHALIATAQVIGFNGMFCGIDARDGTKPLMTKCEVVYSVRPLRSPLVIPY